MANEPIHLGGLNVALHGATLTDFRLDTAARLVDIPFTPSTPTKSGQSAGPLRLVLADVTAVVLTLRDEHGRAPVGRMRPVSREALGELVRDGHELVGFDFIDSERDSYPSGELLFEWYLPEKGAAHILSFYFGLTSREGERALLFFWIYFDSAKLLRPDGSLLPISAFVSVDS